MNTPIGHPLPRSKTMDLLAEAAVANKPRLFAIYGTLRREPEPLIGWGLEFAEGGALFRWIDNGGLHSSDSAGRILQLQSIIADVQLKWLDD